MAETIHFRPACPADLDRLTTLVARSWRALLAPDYASATLREALPILTRPNPSLLSCGTYFVAEADGRLIAAGGWTDVSPHGSPAARGEGHIRQVATDPDHARTGLGRRLMAEVLISAEEMGVTRLRCLSTLTAVPFYTALGFRSAGRIELRVAPGLLFPAVQMNRGC